MPALCHPEGPNTHAKLKLPTFLSSLAVSEEVRAALWCACLHETWTRIGNLHGKSPGSTV